MIPNIAKGKGISGALAYVMGQGNDANTNERLTLAEGEKSRAAILGGQNFGFDIDSAERLDLARRMMEFQGLPENQAGKTRKLDRDCFHASLSWGIGQEPSRAEMMEAGQSFLKAVGLEKALAVLVTHDDTDHRHIHIVASRIDPETGRSLILDNDYIAAQSWGAQWERDHAQERAPEQGKGLQTLIDAVQQRDAEAVLSHLTRDKSTFQAWEVNRALAYGGLAKSEAAIFRADILARPNVLSLSDGLDGGKNRYTTLAVYAEEMALQRSAAKLAQDDRHGIEAAPIGVVSAAYTLKPEQDAALRHLTGREGLAILWGEAGTGKSHLLNATRAAYEAEGKTVVGLSWTNDVVRQMREAGFGSANTIASEMLAVENGRSRWDKNTVLIVDEAAMISTAALLEVTKAAARAGAKLILAGDDAQLSSVERGGMFETLRQVHGAATLKEVQRVKTAEQQEAFGTMHAGDFLKPLQTFEKAGGIHWTTRQSDTLKEMAAKYTDDLAASPDKRRFMFAYTNADVATLNSHARALHQARGDLGADHAINTAQGTAQFATGDRIQFSGNGRTPGEKRAGLTNGRVGTVTDISFDPQQKPRLTVELDAGKGEEPQRVSFVVGMDAKGGEFNQFKHGYAGTIYRGQGRTLDEVYVGHSKQWRSSAAYVALTRHRESVHIFAARETVKDLEAMAKGMARADGKRAATAYTLDETTLNRAALEKAISAVAERPGVAFAPNRAATMAPEAVASSGKAAAAIPAQKGAGRATGAVAAGAARVLDTVADGAAKAIEAIADLFGGASPAPRATGRAAPRHAQEGAGQASGGALDVVADGAAKTIEMIADAFGGASPAPKPARSVAARPAEDDRSRHRQQLLRDFDREVPQEGERDAEIERDRTGRERRRGE